MQILHQNATARTLAALRIAVFGVWFFVILFDPFPDLAHYPTGLFRPPGVLKILPHAAWNLLLTTSGLWTMKILLLAALAGAAVGLKFRATSVASAVLLVFHQGLARGFTYIYHEEIPLLYAAALLALFPCDDAISWRHGAPPVRDGRVYTAAMLSVAAMLSLCFCFAGVYRCVMGGLEIFTSDSLRIWVLRNASISSFSWAGVGPAMVASDTFNAWLKAGLVLVTLIEVLSPFALISKPFRRFYVPAMLFFLAINAILLNVNFWETALLLLVFVDESTAPALFRSCSRLCKHGRRADA
jgi:hypothetical protein